MMTNIYIILSVLSFCSAISVQVPDSIKFKSLSPEDFQRQFLKEDNAILLDVREFLEYRVSRLKGAVNLPSSGNIELAADTINKEKTLFFYCHSGTRSEKAARIFYDKGFRKIYSLKGGITLWKKEGMPVIRKRIRKR
jgi:rhodanese-related sulfurtransferase